MSKLLRTLKQNKITKNKDYEYTFAELFNIKE